MSEPSVIQLMIDSQRRIEAKLDHVMQHGCSKLPDQKKFQDTQSEIFKRLKQIENDRSEDRGKLIVMLMIVGAIVGGTLTMFFRWVGNRFMGF
jgi:hypothetical protein